MALSLRFGLGEAMHVSSPGVHVSSWAWVRKMHSHSSRYAMADLMLAVSALRFGSGSYFSYLMLEGQFGLSLNT